MSPNGFAALPELPPSKEALLRRLVLAGAAADAEEFSRRGLRLAPSERAGVEAWLTRGLETRVADAVASADGSERLVVALADGECVETVVMPDDAVCVSTQVGCAVGCRFCASGSEGLVRNLAVHEIVEQVVHARRRRPSIDRVVFMGIGEPGHNLDAVVETSRVLAEDGGVPGRRQTLSTVGSERTLRRLALSATRPSLSLSLHAAEDAKRRDLLPRAGKEPVAALVAAAEDYGRACGRPVQYAWVLLAGVNDGEGDVDALARLLEGAHGYVNLIPFNAVDDAPFVRPASDRAVAMARALRDRGVLATVRWSAGADAEAACGQLRRSRSR